MILRPSVASGQALAVLEMQSVLDAAERHPDDAWVLVLRDGEAPWSDPWSAVALCIGETSLVVPVLGDWPVACDGEPDAIAPADLVAAMRTIATRSTSPIDPALSLRDMISLEGIARRRVLDAMFEGSAAPVLLAGDAGSIRCEIGMDEDGTAIVWGVSRDGASIHSFDAPAHVAALDVREPVFLSVRLMTIVADGLPHGDCVVLTPRCNGETGPEIEVTLPDAVEVLRYATELLIGTPVVHGDPDDLVALRAFLEASRAAVASMNGDPRRCMTRLEHRSETSVSRSLSVSLPSPVAGIRTLAASTVPGWHFASLPFGVVGDREALAAIGEIRRSVSVATESRLDPELDARVRDEALDWIAAAMIHSSAILDDASDEGTAIIVEREASTGDRFVVLIDTDGTTGDDRRLDKSVPKDIVDIIARRHPPHLRLTVTDGTAILCPTDVDGEIMNLVTDPVDAMRRIASLKEHSR